MITDLHQENQDLRDQVKVKDKTLSPSESVRSQDTSDQNLCHLLETAQSVESVDVTLDVKVPDEESFGKETNFTASTPFIG